MVRELIYWLSLLTENVMSSWVLVKYCNAPIVYLYSVGLSISYPLAVNCFLVTIGVGQDEAFFILNFFSKSLMYFVCLRYIPLTSLCTLIPNKWCRRPRSLREKEMFNWIMKVSKYLLLLLVIIMSSTYMRRSMIWSFPLRTNSDESLLVFWKPYLNKVSFNLSYQSLGACFSL